MSTPASQLPSWQTATGSGAANGITESQAAQLDHFYGTLPSGVTLDPWTGLPTTITSTPQQISTGESGQQVQYTPQQIQQLAQYFTPGALSAGETAQQEAPISYQIDNGRGGRLSGNSGPNAQYGVSQTQRTAEDNMANFGVNSTDPNAPEAIENSEGDGWDKFLNTAVPIGTAALLTAGFAGPAIAAAGAAAGGGATGAVVGGALTGATTAVAHDALTGAPITAKGVLTSAATGALGGGLVNSLGGAVNGATGIGATASDALAGAGIGAAKSALTGGNILSGAVSGGLGGAIQGSGIASTATNALSSEGLPSPLASAITNGVIGAGTGALGSALSGGNAATGAEVGAGSGAVTGAANASGLGALGSAGGIIAGGLLSKYLGSGSSAAAPTTSAAAPATATAPAKSGATVVQPTAPTPTVGKVNAPPSSAAAPQSGATVVSPQPTPTTGTAPANIGSYAGLGYQPMQQVNAGITNYNTYGQGPEASFFAPVQQTGT
jgi:hypothetical protein